MKTLTLRQAINTILPLKFRRCSIFFTFFFIFNNISFAADYYVSTTGSDSNSGTSASSAFATIQRAVNLMSAGDTCYILEGTYHEEIDLSGIAGSEGNPITITNYQGGEVILDGREKVETTWLLESRASVSLPEGNDTPRENIPGIGNVYVTRLTNFYGDVTQLFVDNESMTLARWPNALAFSDEVFVRGTQTLKSSAIHGEGTDMASPFSLAETGVSVTGCVGMFGSVRLITSHSAGSADFSHNNPVRLESGQNYYFIEGGQDNAERVLLDSEQEWAFDESTRMLTLWPENNVDPNTLNIYVRNIMDAFTGDADTNNIVIDGLDFFATKFDFNSSDNITIQNCDFTYYSISERALGVENNSKTADFTGSSTDFCDNILVYNCTFQYADGTGFTANYINGLTFENNLIYKAGYYAAQEWDEYGERRNTNAFIARNSKDILYRRNTVNTSGTNQSVSFGRYGTSSPEYPIVAEYNFNTKCCGLNTDVSSMYIPEEDVHESVVRYNWFIDNNRRDFRWDGGNIDEVKTAKGNFYRNVGIQGTNPNKHAYKLKGDFHEIYNCVAVGDSWAFDIAEGAGGNASTVSRNNAADLWTTILSDDGTNWDLPGDDDKNYRPGSNGYVKTMHEVLRDIDNRDFRPRADAVELIDQGEPVTCTIDGVQVDVTAGYLGSAPDVGAYEYGDPVYWIGGRQEAQASMPIPKDGGVNVPVDADLMYLIGLDGDRARTYLGTSTGQMSMVTVLDNPNNVVSLTGDFALEGNTTYYWRVDTRVNGNWITGNTWSFSTGDGNSNPTESTSFVPDPNKRYYLDVPKHNLRLATDGESEEPYTTSTNATGEDVEWQFVAKGNGYWHLQRAAGGTNPRLRTDNSTSADMQPTTWSGVYTYYGFTTGALNDTHFLTLPDGPNNFKRLQVDQNGNVNMVAESHSGTWESFTITEVEISSNIVHITKRNAPDFAIDGDYDGENAQNVYLWSANENNVNQRWIEIDRGDGYYSYQKEGTNYCIDGNSGGANEQNVYLWVCGENNQNQHWRKVSTADGTFRLEKRNAPAYSLDGMGPNPVNGQNVYLWTSNDNNQNQQWFITPVGTAAKLVPDEFLNNDVLIYPNPVNSVVTIQGASNSKVIIYNINGQELLIQELLYDNETLDLSSLSAGIYYAQVKGEQYISVIKLIKE